ncbi:MAG TPA: serine/threonine-protein kinase, partial [Vicinamibacteria bacterium]|nr:serine/threonine-protein kinase [Vicinamibacteria bacterium]
MTLSEGTLLGPYRILAPLGAGGMGEVYRASDTRLDRTVAIKVLPEHLSKSEEWRARFEREAKVISRLNHPNICTLHDVGREGDIHYLVMEHIEGETLAARLTRDALGLEKVLEYGIQIAQGLDKAHRAGIVHRDLKPGNVMLTKTGVKLLDFGLAKEVAASASSLSGTSDPDAPTAQRALTTERTIVGTLHYMAPEQVTGGPVDHRADVWALGAVLYEMATGNRAFEGSTGTGVMASILEKEPPPGNMPEGLDAVMRSCLTKDADERFQSVHDVKLQLQWLSTRPSLPAET